MDERYVKVHGDWRYLCGAIDRDGALVDAKLSEPRDLAAAKAFFRSARTVTGVVPGRVTTDGHDADPAAIGSEVGEAVRHRMNIYLNNRLGQDHRGIKDRYRSMRGSRASRRPDGFVVLSMSSGFFACPILPSPTCLREHGRAEPRRRSDPAIVAGAGLSIRRCLVLLLPESSGPTIRTHVSGAPGGCKFSARLCNYRLVRRRTSGRTSRYATP